MMPASPDRDGAAPAFALASAVKQYAATRALDNVSLEFARGTTTALIGSSGSGKSTLLRLLLGLEWPDSGTVHADGKPLTASGVLALRRRVGYVIQEGGLFPHLTALENVALLPRYLGWEPQRVCERAEELAQWTHLPLATLARFPAELSGGQRQRVALLRALMLDPEALLLDEPLGALDPIIRHELQGELKRIFAEMGKTVILVTHDLPEAAWLAERLVVMRKGAVVQDGTFGELRAQPADEFVQQFIEARRGLPEMGA